VPRPLLFCDDTSVIGAPFYLMQRVEGDVIRSKLPDAFAEHAAATRKSNNIDAMRALARFIMAEQYADGHFRANSDLPEEPGRKRKREPIYYPGEAILALTRLYAVDPQSAYLDAARRGADWAIHTRDANATEDTQEHDHWMAYACNDLYRATSDPSYLSHAQKIGREYVGRDPTRSVRLRHSAHTVRRIARPDVP